MINLINFAGVKNTLFSINIFNIPVKSEKNIIQNHKPYRDYNTEKIELKKFNDFKTTLLGNQTNIIEETKDDIIVYLFLQKEKDSSARHLVLPVIQERSTRKIIQFGLAWFTFEGIGGGLSCTKSIFHYCQLHFQKGFKVSIVPMVTDNQYLNDFQFFDSGIVLQDIIEKSINLVNYQKGDFKSIFNKYNKLIHEFELNNQP